MEKESTEKLANEHWQWVEDLFNSLPDGSAVCGIATIEYLYKTAFIHGYKHGKKDKS